MTTRRSIGCLLAATALALAGGTPARAQGAAPADMAMAAYRQQMTDLLNLAERACLSNTTTTQSTSLRGLFVRAIGRLSSAVGYTQQLSETRGASRDLPPQLQAIEDDKIRACMTPWSVKILSLAGPGSTPTDTSVAWPEPIDLHLNLIHPPGFDPRKFSDTVQFNLQSSGGDYVVANRLAMQDPHGLAYYDATLRYPKNGETMRGTLVTETRDGYRTTGRPPITTFCFNRPPAMPVLQVPRYEEFDCHDGATCVASGRSIHWLKVCPVQTADAGAAIAHWRRDFVSDGPPAGTAGAGGNVDDRTKWVVPSVGALADADPQGVGYTIFTAQTDLFRTPDVVAVEVDLDVNGTVVLEDGLEPSQRPIPNDPDHPLSINFALQTLDFAGIDRGCDRIGITLNPIGRGGRRLDPVHAQLDYVALRDVLGRTARLGRGQMRWNAGYVIPQREWRAIAELHSYIYRVADPAARDRAADHAVADKKRLDALHLSYGGMAVVGVVRPPRTIQADGTAAFGLAAGLVRPNDQIRFTFSPADEAKLADYLFDLSQQRPEVGQVIGQKAFLFQASSASRTIAGVCDAPL